MTINNILYVDDDQKWRETIQRRLVREVCKNVDVAEDYDSALRLLLDKHYDLIISDGLEGDCFRLYKAISDISHGHFVILSGYSGHIDKAQRLKIPFYDKLSQVDELIDMYKRQT